MEIKITIDDGYLLDIYDAMDADFPGRDKKSQEEWLKEQIMDFLHARVEISARKKAEVEKAKEFQKNISERKNKITAS